LAEAAAINIGAAVAMVTTASAAAREVLNRVVMKLLLLSP
jgi:hypothetical protein